MTDPQSTKPPPPPLELQPPATVSELLDYWAEDYRAHERDWTRPGFMAVALHRFGNYRMHVQRPWRMPLTAIYRVLYVYVRNHMGVELPFSAKIGRRVVIEHQGAIVIHGCTEIGDDSIIRQGVTMGNRRLDQPYDAPILGKRVNVGAGAKLLGKIRVGDGANIGANAVVLQDVPAGGIAAGVPAVSRSRGEREPPP